MKTQSFTKLLAAKLETTVDSAVFNHVFDNYISYITGGINAFAFQRNIHHCVPKSISAKVLRLQLIENRSTYFNLKIFVIRLVKVSNAQKATIFDLARELQVHERDAKRIWDIWTRSPKFRKRIKALYRQIDHSVGLTLEELDKFFSQKVYPEVVKKAKALAYSKLRFIAKSSNLDLADLQNELMIKAIQTYYKEMPSIKSALHVVNYIKRAMIHKSTNIIKEYTSKKKGRFICTGFDKNDIRQFSLLTVSENQLNLSALSNDSQDTASLENLSISSTDTSVKIENEIYVSTLLNKYKAKTKKYRLLLILMGNFDEEFTEWLRLNKHCQLTEDNSDLQDRIPLDNFRQLISQFLNVDADKVGTFLLNLRKSIQNEPISKHITLKTKRRSSTLYTRRHAEFA
jgi:hypothetical protein